MFAEIRIDKEKVKKNLFLRALLSYRRWIKDLDYFTRGVDKYDKPGDNNKKMMSKISTLIIAFNPLCRLIAVKVSAMFYLFYLRFVTHPTYSALRLMQRFLEVTDQLGMAILSLIPGKP